MKRRRLAHLSYWCLLWGFRLALATEIQSALLVNMRRKECCVKIVLQKFKSDESIRSSGSVRYYFCFFSAPRQHQWLPS